MSSYYRYGLHIDRHEIRIDVSTSKMSSYYRYRIRSISVRFLAGVSTSKMSSYYRYPQAHTCCTDRDVRLDKQDVELLPLPGVSTSKMSSYYRYNGTDEGGRTMQRSRQARCRATTATIGSRRPASLSGWPSRQARCRATTATALARAVAQFDALSRQARCRATTATGLAGRSQFRRVTARLASGPPSPLSRINFQRPGSA